MIKSIKKLISSVVLHRCGLAQTEFEIGEYPCLNIVSGSSALTDQSHSTQFQVAAAEHANQYIEYDWSACGGDTRIDAIWFETNELQMTSGTVKFYIDDVECSDSVFGVGTNAQGGVFNCGLTGSKFVARCTDVCSPFMSVIELRVWKYKALTLDGSIYEFAGASSCGNDYTDSSVLFNKGS